MGLGKLRSYAAVAEAEGLSKVHVRQIAGAFHWKDRAAARDSADDLVVRVGMLDARVVAARDDAKVLLMGRAKLVTWLRNLDVTTLSVAEGLRLMEIVLRQGRMLLGDAADILGTGAAAEAVAGRLDPLALELEEFSTMSPGARAERIRHLTRAAEARLAAVSGLDDD